MTSKALIARGSVMRCPKCGQRYVLALGANAVECNRDHPSVQMKKEA